MNSAIFVDDQIFTNTLLKHPIKKDLQFLASLLIFNVFSGVKSATQALSVSKIPVIY